MSDAPLDIRTTGLGKRYGDRVAVEALDLEVTRGELFGLLGPNGAGKSTTIGMLTTLVRPDSGSGEVAGFDIARSRRDVRRRIGIVFQDPTLDIHLTVAENLRFHAELYDMPRARIAPRIDDLLELLEVSERRGDLVRTLSGGLRRRVELARALLHEPQVLFLDEPTLGLDPRARATVTEQVTRLRRELGTTVVLTTHYLAEADGCDRIAVMDQGRIVALDTPAALRAAHGQGGAPAANLDEVFLAVTGRDLRDADALEPALDDARAADRNRSGRSG
ncbi:MAG: daunorubicin resistance transporter ATPase subunit [Thermoleophilia bacterium]|nr:daunorubicin resistance transporter ATPase subunit [Thermoleophilia bacterium]